MKFKRVDETNVECIVTEEDFEEYGVSLDDLVTNQRTAAKMVNDILKGAIDEVGYEPNDGFLPIRMDVVGKNIVVVRLSEDPQDALDDMLDMIDNAGVEIPENLLEQINDNEDASDSVKIIADFIGEHYDEVNDGYLRSDKKDRDISDSPDYMDEISKEIEKAFEDTEKALGCKLTDEDKKEIRNLFNLSPNSDEFFDKMRTFIRRKVLSIKIDGIEKDLSKKMTKITNDNDGVKNSNKTDNSRKLKKDKSKEKKFKEIRFDNNGDDSFDIENGRFIHKGKLSRDEFNEMIHKKLMNSLEKLEKSLDQKDENDIVSKLFESFEKDGFVFCFDSMENVIRYARSFKNHKTKMRTSLYKDNNGKYLMHFTIDKKDPDYFVGIFSRTFEFAKFRTVQSADIAFINENMELIIEDKAIDVLSKFE